MNKIYFKIISIILLIIIFLSFKIEIKADDDYRVLGLGDSITTGYGVSKESAYFNLVSNHLKTMYNDKFSSFNKSVNGLTSEGLLQSIKNDSEIRNLIKSSNLIIISIGGNDFLTTIFNIFSPNALEVFKAVKNNLLKNINLIYEEINILNNNVSIVLIPLYNPYYDILKDKKDLLEVYIKTKEGFNQFNKKYNNVYIPTSLSETLELSKYLSGGLDPHPSVLGHELISKEVIKIIDTLNTSEVVKKEFNIKKLSLYIVISLFILILLVKMVRRKNY